MLITVLSFLTDEPFLIENKKKSSSKSLQSLQIECNGPTVLFAKRNSIPMEVPHDFVNHT